MLALLLAMGGAWAQGPTIVWGDGTTNLILANNYTADGITFTTSDGSNVFSSGLWYFEDSVAFTSAGGNFTRIEMIIANNLNNSWNNQDGWTVDATTAVWEGDANQVVISRCTTYVKQITFICAEASIKLTPDATGKVWTLDETPDYDLDLNVVYYQKYALKEIPANWQVKVDGVDKTAAIDGDSLKISETAQVLLTPDHPEYVKSVTLLDVAGPQTLIVAKGSTELSGNKELYYITGDTYRQALARPENQSGNDLGWGFWESSDLTTIYFKEVSDTPYDMAIDSDYNFATDMGTCAITLDSVIDPNHAFQFVAAQ